MRISGLKMSSGESATAHKTQRVVLRYIDAHPGVSATELARVLGISEGTIRYHLAQLERDGSVFSRKEQAGRFYYREEQPQKTKGGDSEDAVLRLIKKDPGITTGELEDRSGLSRRNLNYHLKRLREREVVRAVRYGRQWGYEHITPQRLKHEMLRKILMKYLKDEIDEDTLLQLKDELEQT
jgi:predicted transcriptional regulator